MTFQRRAIRPADANAARGAGGLQGDARLRSDHTGLFDASAHVVDRPDRLASTGRQQVSHM